MSQTSETGAVTAQRPVILRWLSVPVGLVATWAWIAYSPALLDKLTYSSDFHAVVSFYLVLFAPLIVLAAILGFVCGCRVFRVGAAPFAFLLLGLATGGIGLAVAVAYAWLNGGIVPGSGQESLVIMGLPLILLQTSAEEFLVRGWLQQVLIGLTSPVAGVLLASVMFAGLHLASGPVAPHSLLNMVLAGCFFGVLAWRSGGLVAPVAAHFAWNAVEDFGFGLVPNPGLGPFGSLVDLDLAGAELWGGGAEGLNASIGTTIVLAALILPLVAWRPKQAPLPA
ncbi:MAG: CPBP family intramembrane metalloprotease [Novosphingobium sp.]|nr:CPBP family intramembrane metalloprotease [Novosphingobium sp.]